MLQTMLQSHAAVQAAIDAADNSCLMLQVWFHAVVKAAVGAAHKLFVYAETQVSIVIACMIAILANMHCNTVPWQL